MICKIWRELISKIAKIIERANGITRQSLKIKSLIPSKKKPNPDGFSTTQENGSTDSINVSGVIIEKTKYKIILIAVKIIIYSYSKDLAGVKYNLDQNAFLIAMNRSILNRKYSQFIVLKKKNWSKRITLHMGECPGILVFKNVRLSCTLNWWTIDNSPSIKNPLGNSSKRRCRIWKIANAT